MTGAFPTHVRGAKIITLFPAAELPIAEPVPRQDSSGLRSVTILVTWKPHRWSV